MKDPEYMGMKLKDLTPLEVVFLVMEKAWRKFLTVIDSIQEQGGG